MLKNISQIRLACQNLLNKIKNKDWKKYLSTFSVYNDREEIKVGIIAVITILSMAWITLTAPPFGFTDGTLIDIEKGSSLNQISIELQNNKIIRSRLIFNTVVILLNKEDKIISGEYIFHEPLQMNDVIKRLLKGDYGIEIKKVFIPEGITIEQMADVLDSKLYPFNKEAFIELAQGKEGYLFPDTYFFPENIKADEVIEILEENFNQKIKKLEDDLGIKIENLSDTIILASIVEEEASEDSRKEVANILWNRLENDIPLQVDATFVYSINKHSFNVTLDEIRDDTNPYNTYEFKGLPPTPISNPGLESIEAVLTPEPTDYFYFLTGHDGNMYYAKTFEGHKQNKARYLR